MSKLSARRAPEGHVADAGDPPHRLRHFDASAGGGAEVLFFLWPFYLVSGPAAVILGIYGWKKPGSLLRRSRWRFVAGIVGGVIQVLAVVGIGVAMFFASREGAFR